MGNIKNRPELRFGGFFGDWENRRIQSLINEKIILGLLDGNHGELYPRSEEFSSEGIPYVSASDLVDSSVNVQTSKKLPLERAAKFKKGIAKSGDVLFAHNATVGPTALLETTLDYVILSTTVTYYRCDLNVLDNKYLLHSLNSVYFVKQYSRVMSQSTRNQVPITAQRKFYLSLPSLSEQQKIAAFLGAVDAKLTALRRKRELLQEYKRGMMQKIFSREMRFKGDDGVGFPGWVERRLGEVIKNNGGTALEKFVEPLGTHKFISIGNYTVDGKYIDNGQRINSVGKAATKVLDRNDLVMVLNDKTSTGDLIGSSILINHSDKYIYNQRSERIICTNGFLPKFAWFLFNSAFFRKKIVIASQGGTQIYINFPVVKKFYVEIPPIEEQQKIADWLSAIDSKIESVAGQIAQVETFKKGLLQKMFV